jgi:hypothetical protein
MAPYEFLCKASGAFYVLPRELLAAELNPRALAYTVEHDLFAGHPSGWSAYATALRGDAPSFGGDLPLPQEPEDIEQ